MIDEELYQRAADELNSENRRPHIWARACALADDDHDEARYLYTNLRVEELLAEAERDGGVSSTRTPLESPEEALELEPIEYDALSELETLPEVGDGRVESFAAGQGVGATPLPGGVDDGSPRLASTRARMSFDLESDATLDLEPEDVRRLEAAEADAPPALDESLAPEPHDDHARPSEEDATISLEDALGPADPVDDGDGQDALDALFEAGETVPVPSEGPPSDTAAPSDPFGEDEPIDGSSAERALVLPGGAHPEDDDPHDDPADDSVVETIDADDVGVDDVGVDDTVALDPRRAIPGRRETGIEPATGANPLDDLDWLDEAYRTERQNLARPAPPPASDDDGDALTRELRRQAEELPDGETDSVIPHATFDTLPVRRVGPDVDAERVGGSVGESVYEPVDTAAPVGTADEESGAFALTDGPLEITDERGGDTEYAVFVDASGKGRATQAVRQGGSWGALVATVPWLIHRRLIGTAIVYVLFAVVVLAGLAATALAWQEAGSAASPLTKGATIGFALLALAGLVVVPFRNANHWREDKLEARGFDLVAYVRTRDRERALALARERDGRRA